MGNNKLKLNSTQNTFTIQPRSSVPYEQSENIKRLRVNKLSYKITGSPGSVRVPQYDSSNEITVFGWGKNSILNFVRNTKKELNKTYSCTLV